jgi:nucleoside-diphosphate-sugar epimerase
VDVPKTVLITGASGFVGANLARRVLSEGHQTHLLLRPSHQTWRLEGLAKEAQLHYAGLEDRQAVQEVIDATRPDWVFHLAAFGAYSSQTGFDRMVTTNLVGCANLLDACVKRGVEAFIHTGSSSEYGLQDHPAVETDRLEPNSDYAIMKAAATHYCQHTARSRNINAITVRLYSIYGPYEEPTRLIPTLIVHGLRGTLPPLASPATARDFVYVDNAVEGLLRLASAPNLPRGSIYNLSTGVQTRLDQVVAVARRLMHVAQEPVWSSMPTRVWDTDSWVGCPDLLEQVLKWRPSVPFEHGLARTIEWLQDVDRRSFYSSRVFRDAPNISASESP